MAIKIEEGDFRGAIRLASSEDTLADFSDDTLTALKAKHPLPHPNSHIPPPPSNTSLLESLSRTSRQSKSFPSGSAGGPDKLRPHHLKDLLQSLGDNVENPLLSALVNFTYLVLRGDTPELVRPLFFGASLGALRKKCRGVLPIAVGCTLRHLVAKVACNLVMDDALQLLAPCQLVLESVVGQRLLFTWRTAFSITQAMIKPW